MRPVELVEVDVVGLQTRQALIGRSQQIRTPEMSRQGLGREKDTITHTSNCFAGDLFGTVGLRRIDEARRQFDPSPERFHTTPILPGPEPDLSVPANFLQFTFLSHPPSAFHHVGADRA